MHKKILSTFLILLFVTIISNLTQVYGVGIVSHAWVNGTGDDRYLLFRTYTGAFGGEVGVYHTNNNKKDEVEKGKFTYDGTTYTTRQYKYNGKYHTSKWIYDGTNIPTPGYSSFSTIGFLLHNEQIGNYDEKNDDPYYGYNLLTYDTITGIGNNLIDLETLLNSSERRYTTPDVNYDIERYAQPLLEGKHNDLAFYTIMGMSGGYKTNSAVTGIRVENLKSSNKQLTYRHAIVELNSKQIYIDDKIISGNDLDTIIAKREDDTIQNEVYISNIVISRSYSGGYDLSTTLYDFFEQGKNIDNLSKGWMNGTKRKRQ